MRWLRRRWGEPVDGASLAALRVLFGSLMFAATVRFALRGWIDALYVKPSFHFTYYGFDWVQPWPRPLLYAHFGLLALASLMVALGFLYRVASLALALLFLYVELLDVTTYLNHYYAISLVSVLLCFAPASNVLSLDAYRARRRGAPLPACVPRVSIDMLRLQLGIVYFFAGLAKLQTDWLIHAQPLTTWLSARTDVPLLGPLLALPYAPLVMSWLGALFDLCIPFFLAWRRSRAPAYLAVVVFHVVTGALFQIGMFPWIMIALTPSFFAPDWPRRLLGRFSPANARRAEASSGSAPLGRAATAACALWLSVQLLLPLRHHLYAGDVLTNEQGFRWSWHVMIVERSGTATFRVQDAQGRMRHVNPARELTPLQVRMLATQPDLILAYARHLRAAYAARGEQVRVFADVFVATNGRPSARLVDPDVDLGAQEDTLWGYPWLLPQPPRD